MPKSFALLRTVNQRTGASRYFIDGKRVSRAAYDEVGVGRVLECFSTRFDGGVTRYYCTAREGRKVKR